ncbi:hypothetical protein [Hymenobacter nivis]|uniref:hypothetical protein n=1 Tax=Hymenobacter nivis TaxID=1850093 RepID=UPI0011277F47|nr:hypothetical protein [Hymenobacter nivis]
MKILKYAWEVWPEKDAPASNKKYDKLNLSVVVSQSHPLSKEEKTQYEQLMEDEHANFYTYLLHWTTEEVIPQNCLQDIILTDYDHNEVYYSVDKIRRWLNLNVGNQLWVAFEYKYNKSYPPIKIDRLPLGAQKQILNLARRIDEKKYKKSSFDRHLLADLGTDIDSHYLPNLYTILADVTSPLPKSLMLTLHLLIVVIGIGVLAPMILISIDTSLSPTLFRTCVFTVALVLTGSLMLFSLILKRVLVMEARVIE